MSSIRQRVVKGLGRRTADFHFPISGYWDAKRLCKLFPMLREYEQLAKSCPSELRVAHMRYIEEVSTGDMAVSLKLAAFLYTLAAFLRPERILDLGSGFSSYVFRLHASNEDPGVCVHSVDDCSEWLDKTKSFLESYNLGSDNLILWPKFREVNNAKYDLILHDLGTMELRADSLSYVLTLARENGVIILDDTHKWGYWIKAVKEIQQAGFGLYSLYRYTLDENGRFSHIAIRHNPYQTRADALKPHS